MDGLCGMSSARQSQNSGFVELFARNVLDQRFGHYSILVKSRECERRWRWLWSESNQSRQVPIVSQIWSVTMYYVAYMRCHASRTLRAASGMSRLFRMCRGGTRLCHSSAEAAVVSRRTRTGKKKVRAVPPQCLGSSSWNCHLRSGLASAGCTGSPASLLPCWAAHVCIGKTPLGRTDLVTGLVEAQRE